jgi:carbon monoxide dehydrogenase subunit G
MLISNEFEVQQPLDTVWEFFGDVPAVAACLPGAELTDDLGDDRYAGRVGIRMGPVRLEFAGKAEVRERDDDTKRMVIDAAGSDRKNRGSAELTVTARLTPGSGGGTRVAVDQDLQISGAAAQYGRGMISDVTAVLMRDFSANMQDRIERIERGESAEQIAAATGTPARGFTLGMRAALMALSRVFRRFFLPYQPAS